MLKPVQTPLSANNRFGGLEMLLKSLIVAASVALNAWALPPVKAQLPLDLNLQTLNPLSSNAANQVNSGCIRLDGRCLFQVADFQERLPNRIKDIEQNLTTISEDYFQSDASELKLEIRQENSLPVIYINGQRFLTVTNLDAELQGETPAEKARRLIDLLPEDLQQAKQERQFRSLARQGAIASSILIIMVLSSWGIHYWQRRSTPTLIPAALPAEHPVTNQLTQQQNQNLQEVKRRVFQLGQAAVWGGGGFIILGLFPYTRSLQIWLLSALNIPVGLSVVGLGTYVAIRLSYALIDRCTAILASGYLLTPEASQRLNLRVSTISGVTKSIATLIGLAIGTLVALSTLGVNIAPVLAGAGLIGVAVSLASQSIIKDAINGFLIILEDQYAIGDVIAVGEFGGLVENINLRITQLRDAEGRLITIPNSEIKTVANLSSSWSRADLGIPVAYNTDVNQALKLIETVALEMKGEAQWHEQILETPQVLGVDDFGNRGVILRVWIKTRPLKQWDVAREFRRRLKVAFDQAGIPIPPPQQEIWYNNALPLPAQNDFG